ncbi:MAG: hypothetical protein EBR82_44790 [Caulobacteraceae bacterium]|nr:hypothetical protein [Caulobacteraceae bacterium]
MGAAAALIPGIAGIAGGQYMKNREENQQAAQDQRLMAGARQLMTGGAGNARNPITGQVEPSMANQSAIIGTMAGSDPRVAKTIWSNTLEQLGKPASIPKRVNLINPTTGKTWSGPEAAAAAFGPEWQETGLYTPPPKEPTTELSKYISEYNGLSPDDPNRIIYKQIMENMGLPKGFTFESDGKGGYVLTQGGGGGRKGDSTILTTPNVTAAQTSIMQTDDSLAQLDSIGAKFKPEYLELGTRWGNMKNSFLEKAGFQLNPDDQKSLYEFKSFARDAIANVNQIIKNITGATVGEKEAPRLYEQMPMVGTGLFDGDSPTEFKAKYDATVTSLNSAKARQFYALKKGLTKEQMFETLPLESIPSLIQKKGDEIEFDLKKQNPGLEKSTIEQMVKSRLRQEFGL